MAKDKTIICDSCLGMGNLEPETEEGDYEKCEDCNGTGIEPNDPHRTTSTLQEIKWTQSPTTSLKH